MTALDDTPSNLNMLNPNHFEFVVQRLPTVNFFVQDVLIPGMVLPSIKNPNPLVNLKEPGDHINFNMFSISFKIDENMTNYLELYNWIKALGFPENYDQYTSLTSVAQHTGMGLKSDMSVILLNSQRIPNIEIVLRDAFPIIIGDLNLSTRNSDVAYLTCTASFEYNYSEISLIT